MGFFRDLKSFFKYNRSERRGISLLLLLLILILLARLIIPEFAVEEETYENSSTVQKRYLELKQYLDSLDQASKPEAFRLDTAGPNEWRSLGLDEWQIDIIENYRNSGATILNWEDLKVVYGIKADWLEANRKYLIAIPDSNLEIESVATSSSQKLDDTSKPYVFLKEQHDTSVFDKAPHELSIDINRAGTEQLEQIYGVGPKRASIIINYRTALGGFYSKSQINEIYSLPPEVKEEIIKSIIVNSFSVKLLSFSKSSFKDFLRHPYLDYFYTKTLFEAASKKDFAPQDISGLPEISDSLYRKIIPYLER